MKLQIAFIKLQLNVNALKLQVSSRPFYEYEDQLPHGPALHVVEVDEEEAEPDPRGDVALEHDHAEQDATEHRPQLRGAQQPANQQKKKSYSLASFQGFLLDQ